MHLQGNLPLRGSEADILITRGKYQRVNRISPKAKKIVIAGHSITFTLPAVSFHIYLQPVLIMSVQANPQEHNVQKLHMIREKIKQVFGTETSLNDDMLLTRYTISGDGDLIMILR